MSRIPTLQQILETLADPKYSTVDRHWGTTERAQAKRVLELFKTVDRKWIKHMEQLTKPCDDTLPIFGAAHYHERRDAGAALTAAGFRWNHEQQRWFSTCGEITAFVRWSETFGKFFISAI